MDASSTNHALQGCIVGMFNGGRGLQGQNHDVQHAKTGVGGSLSPNEMDRIIAKEMTELSLQERMRAEEDVHGVGSGNEEDALSLQSNLLQMQICLDNIKKGTVYEEAERIDSTYSRNRDLRLMFIRADRYNPQEAAGRMVRWFELKKSLFGSEKLCKTITLDDLNEDDMECLRSGYMQLPPFRDMAGRVIAVGMMKLRKMKNKDNVSRVSFYTFMAAMESVDAQKRGMVCVYYLLDATNFSSVTGNLRSIMPVHMASLHLCYNDLQQYAVTCMGVYALNQQTKVRFRPHYGSHMECQYALTTFGIPRPALPVSASGEMFVDRHLQWLTSRQRLETERRQQHMEQALVNHLDNCVPQVSLWAKSPEMDEKGVQSKILLAGSSGGITFHTNDVLFGRGKSVVGHEGNSRFRNLVAEHAEEFDKVSRLEKTHMTETIVQKIKASGGRFLKRDDDGGWEEVDHDTARKKVAHAFRNRRKLPHASSRDGSSNSSSY